MKSPIIGAVVKSFALPSFAGLVPNVSAFNYVEPPWIKQLEAVNRQLQFRVGKQLEAIAGVRPLFAQLGRLRERCDRLEAAGWLPHHTTPFGLVDDLDDDPLALAEALDQHYAQTWPEVRACY